LITLKLRTLVGSLASRLPMEPDMSDTDVELISTTEAGLLADPPMTQQAVIAWCKKYPELVVGRIGRARMIRAARWLELMKARRRTPPGPRPTRAGEASHGLHD
jgi:hypothetical protein